VKTRLANLISTMVLAMFAGTGLSFQMIGPEHADFPGAQFSHLRFNSENSNPTSELEAELKRSEASFAILRDLRRLSAGRQLDRRPERC
jgi:hypothetical protein